LIGILWWREGAEKGELQDKGEEQAPVGHGQDDVDPFFWLLCLLGALLLHVLAGEFSPLHFLPTVSEQNIAVLHINSKRN
jgi:hypothetical protein